MTGNKTNKLLATGAGVLAIGWLGTWTTELTIAAGKWPVRLGLLLGGLALTAISLGGLLRHYRDEFRAAQRHLDALCRADPRNPLGSEADLPPLRSDNAWAPLAAAIRQAFLEHGRQIQDLDQERTAMEIRCRRAVAEAERVKAVFAGLPEPILAIDDYYDVVLTNRSADELFHLDSANTETRALARLVHCHKLLELLTATARSQTTRQRSDELEIPDSEGHPRYYRVTAARLGDSGDAQEQSGGAVAVLRDIADQKALQKRNAEFVSAVSHEMKTPLAGIKAYVELLADGDAEDEQTREEFLGVINGQADRLQRLVENLLNLARIEAGVVSVNKQPRSLNELLEEAVRVVQPSAEAKNIELASDLSPMYLGVLADRDMLLQAAINLLSNAIKYTPRDGRVTLRSRMEGEEVRFEVQDTGVGLSPEDSRRVFEKFYRVKKDKDMAPGTGLGLPLAKHIVEDVHNGRLDVESTLGVGSTFAVTLPGAGVMSKE